MSQNALGQSDYSIYKSTISVEQNNEKACFFCKLIQFHEKKKLTEKYWGGHDQKWVWSHCSQDSKYGFMLRKDE